MVPSGPCARSGLTSFALRAGDAGEPEDAVQEEVRGGSRADRGGGGGGTERGRTGASGPGLCCLDLNSAHCSCGAGTLEPPLPACPSHSVIPVTKR